MRAIGISPTFLLQAPTFRFRSQRRQRKSTPIGEPSSRFVDDVMEEGDPELEYFEVHRSKWSADVSHGIGPMMSKDRHASLPRYIAVEDLRIATDTEISFRNLIWLRFASPTPPATSRAGLFRRPAANSSGTRRW